MGKIACMILKQWPFTNEELSPVSVAIVTKQLSWGPKKTASIIELRSAVFCFRNRNYCPLALRLQIELFDSEAVHCI